MIDYYEELSLSRNLDTKQIQEELVRLESLWHKREVNSPEKANKMLGIIMDAQKAFALEASRKKYDNDLEASRREPEDPDVSRSKSLEKWSEQAEMFYNDGQYDLAKASIDRALNYIDNESDNGDLFRLAADIYLENDDLRLSMECINKAIITSPDWADYYIVKARIYERMSFADQQYDKRQSSINECRNNLKHAVSKAKAGGDTVTEGDALGMLAFSLYFQLNPDTALAEEYAQQAVVLGEYTNSKRVLDDIAEKKNSPIYNEAKKEEGYGNLQHFQKALELYESLGGWRDASERAAACRTRIGQLEAEEIRRRQEEQRQRAEQARKAKEAEEEKKRQAQAELEAQRKKREQTIKFVKKAAPFAAAAIVVMILINSFFIPNGKYHSAQKLMKSGNYDEAISAFQSLNGFRSSEKKIDECYDAISQEKYAAAVSLMNEGKFEEAIAAFDALDDYGDSALQASSCKDAIMQLQYEAATSLMEEGKYEEAMAVFDALGDYGDSALQASSCKDAIMQLQYEAAIGLMEEKKYEEAIDAFKDMGDYKDSVRFTADSYYELGSAYLYGLDGREMNCKKACYGFSNALKLGKKEANFYMGLLYDYYKYPKLDYKKAAAYYEATEGDKLLQAQYALGLMYYNGNGVAQDIAQAQAIFENVIAAGCADGYMGLGAMAHDNGDYDTALKDYNIVVEESDEQVIIARAMNAIGNVYSDSHYAELDYGKAMEWYGKAVELGYPAAMYNIGRKYFYGEYVEQDYGKALEWYKKAAELGNNGAMFYIGWMYYNGEYVEQDYGKAMEWYEKAAELGNAGAMCNIGYMYDEGIYVEKDYEKAMEWYEKSAKLGDDQAMNNIGWMYEDGHYVERNYEKAMEWYKKSAELGNVTAMNNIGALYENGRGVQRDSNKAKEWYDKAAAAENQ